MSDLLDAKKPRGFRSRGWIAVVGAILVVAIVIVIVLTTRSPAAPSASRAVAQLNSQIQTVISATGGSWKNATESGPWVPIKSARKLLVSCEGHPALTQYQETAIGPGFRHPDQVAAQVAEEWKRLHYTTEVTLGFGASATTAGGGQVILNTTSVYTQVVAWSSCF